MWRIRAPSHGWPWAKPPTSEPPFPPCHVCHRGQDCLGQFKMFKIVTLAAQVKSWVGNWMEFDGIRWNGSKVDDMWFWWNHVPASEFQSWPRLKPILSFDFLLICFWYPKHWNPARALAWDSPWTPRELLGAKEAEKALWSWESWESWESPFLNFLSLVSSFCFCFLYETCPESTYCAKHTDMNWPKARTFPVQKPTAWFAHCTPCLDWRIFMDFPFALMLFLFLPCGLPIQNDTCQAFGSQVSG